MAVEKKQQKMGNILQSYTYQLQRLLPPEYYQVVDSALIQFNQLIQDNKILEIRLQGANDCIQQLTGSYQALDQIANDKQRQVTILQTQLQQQQLQLEQFHQVHLSSQYKLAQYQKAITILQDDLKQAHGEIQSLRNAKLINKALNKIKFEQELQEMVQRGIAGDAPIVNPPPPEPTNPQNGEHSQPQQPAEQHVCPTIREVTEPFVSHQPPSPSESTELQVEITDDVVVEQVHPEEQQNESLHGEEPQEFARSQEIDLAECLQFELEGIDLNVAQQSSHGDDLTIDLSDEQDDVQPIANEPSQNQQAEQDLPSKQSRTQKKVLKRKKQPQKAVTLKDTMQQDLFGDSGLSLDF